jgi:hypothetical protein
MEYAYSVGIGRRCMTPFCTVSRTSISTTTVWMPKNQRRYQHAKVVKHGIPQGNDGGGSEFALRAPRCKTPALIIPSAGGLSESLGYRKRHRRLELRQARYRWRALGGSTNSSDLSLSCSNWV